MALMPNMTFASNYRDTPYSFTTGVSTSGFATEARAKTDYTSSSLKVTSAKVINGSYANPSFYACIYGGNTGTFVRDYYNGVGSQRTAVTVKSDYYFLYNFVRENSENYAKLHYETITPYTTFYGVWSPDSK